MNNSSILLFDGYCNLCSGFVNFIIKHDAKKQIRFASMQSKKGMELLRQHQLSEELKTVYLIDEETIYGKSEAVHTVASHLGFPWSLIRLFKIFGRTINDTFYDFVARNRYRWFGKKDRCMVPAADVLDRFLTD